MQLIPLLAVPLLVLGVAAAQAQPGAHDPHGHDDHHDAHDHPHDDHHHADRHRPAGVAARGHRHAHPKVDLTHPIVLESPLPETHLRLDYGVLKLDGDGGREYTAQTAVEYAFTPNFSVEAVLPYVIVDPDDAPSTDRLGDIGLAAKFATDRFLDRHILPAIGLEIALPTGNEERGIGSDHVIELEPFARIGYWVGRFELIGVVEVAIPLNQTKDERDEEDFAIGYGLSALYRVADDIQLLVELEAEHVFGSEDASSYSISPGITFQPFRDKSITIGVGATLPLDGDEDEFDYAINLMTIIHL